MRQPLVFMFSGQGSHYYQMGRDLYDQHEVFRNVMNEGNEILRPVLHRSIVDEIFLNPLSKPFDDLVMSHPALVLVEYAAYRVLHSEGIRPDYVWGSSAGEFSAAIVAGIFDFETALLLSAQQAKLTASLCGKGGMLAVLDEPELYHRSSELNGSTTLAGINFPKNFVISGDVLGLENAADYLGRNGLVYQRLPVGYAFHSSGIDALKVPFLDICSKMGKFKSPEIPFLSSAEAGILNRIDQDYFWEVARGPIRFYQTFLNFPHRHDSIFIDCGPSGTLSTFIKYSLTPGSRSSFFPLLTPYQKGQQHLAALKSHLYATA